MRSSDNSKPQLRGQWGQPLAIEAIFGSRKNLFFIEAGNKLAFKGKCALTFLSWLFLFFLMNLRLGPWGVASNNYNGTKKQCEPISSPSPIHTRYAALFMLVPSMGHLFDHLLWSIFQLVGTELFIL